MDLDPHTLSDADLESITNAALTEMELRRTPAMITAIARTYLAGGGDIANLTAAITASQTPEEPTP